MSFVSKPKVAATSTAKKPAFRVLRKKASLTNKKNVDLIAKFSLTSPQISTTETRTNKEKPQETESIPEKTDKTSSLVERTSNKAVTALLPRLESQANVQSNTGIARKPKAPTATANRTVISSLFKFNPEIPVVKKEAVETTKETVFSLKSFSDLELHDHLV